MKQLLVVLILSLTGPLLAMQDDHDSHEDFAEGTLLVLEGQDSITRQVCSIFVMDVGFTGPEQTVDQFYAVVLTSYTHAEDRPDPIQVQFQSQNNSLLSGVGSNLKDQIVIQTESGSQDLTQLKSYSLRWLHGNHYHNSRCENLEVHEH